MKYRGPRQKEGAMVFLLSLFFSFHSFSFSFFILHPFTYPLVAIGM